MADGSTAMEDVASTDNPELVEAAQLLEKIAQNPYDYDTHVAYISLLRKLGEVSDLRQAREVFHEFFPLSEDLWVQWLDDEEASAEADAESLQSLFELHERATQDYLSINLWIRYLKFAEKHANVLANNIQVEASQFLDMCYKKAGVATQYHVPESQRVWELERNRRLAMLNADTKQLSAVTRMYTDRLKIPHAQMEDTYQEFSSFISKHHNDDYEKIMSSTSKDYGKALKALREREIFELQLTQTNYSYEAYSAYLQWELSNGPKIHITPLTKTLFERALVTWWQQGSVWEDYASFAIQKKFDEDEITIILDRAVRNCPWSGGLWSFNIRFQAQIPGVSFEHLFGYKERAIGNSWLTANPSELANVLYAWMMICRLQTDDLYGQIEGITSLEDEAEDCVQKVGTAYNWPEGYLLGKLLVQLKTLANDPEEANEIWEKMAKVNGTSCSYWLDRIEWEREDGEPERCLDHFKKNLFKITDQPGRFCYAYLSFLVEVKAPIDELNAAYAKIQKVLKKNVPVQPSQAQATQSATVTEAAPVDEPSISEHKRKLSMDGEEPSSKKVKTKDDHAPQRDREHSTVIATNFPEDTTEDQVRHFFKDCGKMKRLEEINRPDLGGKSFIIEFERESDAATALTRNMKSFKGQEISVERHEQTVLWVTNYPATYDEAKLKELLSEFGTVKEVRLPSLAFNTSRRFAYIEFTNSDEATAALAADGRKLEDGHVLMVKLSDPRKKKKRESAAEEGRELFIVNIDFDATEEDVRKLLAEHGEIQSLKLLTQRGEKKHSGRGFVVYATKEQADSALTLNGTKFMSRILKIQRSDPQHATHTKSNTNLSGPRRAVMNQGQASQTSGPPRTIGKAIGIIGLPDTVNEARLRIIIPENLAISKVEMRPEHEGAIVEFENPADAGQADIAINGKEEFGNVLRVVTVRELKQHFPRRASDTTSATSFVPSAVKFGAQKKRGGKR